MCRCSATFILAPTGCLGGPLALPCGPLALANQYLKFRFPRRGGRLKEPEVYVG